MSHNGQRDFWNECFGPHQQEGLPKQEDPANVANFLLLHPLVVVGFLAVVGKVAHDWTFWSLLGLASPGGYSIEFFLDQPLPQQLLGGVTCLVLFFVFYESAWARCLFCLAFVAQAVFLVYDGTFDRPSKQWWWTALAIAVALGVFFLSLWQARKNRGRTVLTIAVVLGGLAAAGFLYSGWQSLSVFLLGSASVIAAALSWSRVKDKTAPDNSVFTAALIGAHFLLISATLAFGTAGKLREPHRFNSKNERLVRVRELGRSMQIAVYVGDMGERSWFQLPHCWHCFFSVPTATTRVLPLLTGRDRGLVELEIRTTAPAPLTAQLPLPGSVSRLLVEGRRVRIAEDLTSNSLGCRDQSKVERLFSWLGEDVGPVSPARRDRVSGRGRVTFQKFAAVDLVALYQGAPQVPNDIGWNYSSECTGQFLSTDKREGFGGRLMTKAGAFTWETFVHRTAGNDPNWFALQEAYSEASKPQCLVLTTAPKAATLVSVDPTIGLGSCESSDVLWFRETPPKAS